MQVYVINNLANGKLYIGQHRGKDLQKYLKQKVADALGFRQKFSRLFNAIRKHGADNFTIGCIHKCVDKAEMDSAEKAYIKLFGTQDPELGYNITAGGEGSFGFTHSEASKIRMSESRTGLPTTEKQKLAVSLAHKGKPLSAEHRLKMSASAKGRKLSDEQKQKLRKPRSEETKAKVSAGLKRYFKAKSGGTGNEKAHES